MTDFLHDQVPARIFSQVGQIANGIEILPIAMQIGSDQHFVGPVGLQLDDVPLAVLGIRIGDNRLAIRLNDPLDVLNRGNHTPSTVATRWGCDKSRAGKGLCGWTRRADSTPFRRSPRPASRVKLYRFCGFIGLYW